MVSPTAAGRGVGRALAHHVLGVATQEGYAAMQFNAVVETNQHAVRLWESLGFTILATVPKRLDILTGVWSGFTSCTSCCDSPIGRDCAHTDEGWSETLGT